MTPMRVHDVYCNLNRGGLSARHVGGPNAGRLAAHAETALIDDATFRVQPGGQARCRRDRRRNVHAFVRGTCQLDVPVEALFACRAAVALRYNPFELDGFATLDGRRVVAARRVALAGKRMVAFEPTFAADARPAGDENS